MYCFVWHIHYLSWFVKKPIKEAESNSFAPALIKSLVLLSILSTAFNQWFVFQFCLFLVYLYCLRQRLPTLDQSVIQRPPVLQMAPYDHMTHLHVYLRSNYPLHITASWEWLKIDTGLTWHVTTPPHLLLTGQSCSAAVTCFTQSSSKIPMSYVVSSGTSLESSTHITTKICSYIS